MASTPSKLVVIARYKEDIDWVEDLDVPVKVYNKGKLGKNRLKNVGLDPNTFMRHIYMNYNKLADYTFFLQGDPSDHFTDCIDFVNDHTDQEKAFLADQIVTDNRYGMPNNDYYLPMDVAWNLLFESKAPQLYSFGPGCQFLASREMLRQRSRKFYKKCIDITLWNEKKSMGAFTLERLIPHILGDTQ